MVHLSQFFAVFSSYLTFYVFIPYFQAYIIYESIFSLQLYKFTRHKVKHIDLKSLYGCVWQYYTEADLLSDLRHAGMVASCFFFSFLLLLLLLLSCLFPILSPFIQPYPQLLYIHVFQSLNVFFDEKKKIKRYIFVSQR
jgi:hypothetical protein